MPVRRVRYAVNKNPVRAFIGSLLAGIIAVIISLPLYIPIILALPTISATRWLLFKIYSTRSDHNYEPELMSSSEERWMSSSEGSIMHAVLVLDNREPLTMDQFRRILSTRVIPLYPRLTRLPVALPLSAGAGFCWIPDSKFSILRHVFHGPSSVTSRKLAQSYVAQLMHELIDSGKPPWEFHIITPVGRQKDTLVIARVHKSIGDGSELLRVLCHSLADTPSVDIPERPQFGGFSYGLNVLRAVLTGPCMLLIWLWLTTTDGNPISSRCNFSGQMTLSWSASVTLPKVMRIKQVTRSTVNCVILSALAGAVRVLLQSCGIGHPPNIKVLVPVDIRSQNMNKSNRTCLGNKSTTMTICLPVEVEGCVPRLWATRRALSSLNSSSDPVVLYMATAALMTMASAATGCFFLDLLANKTTIQYSSIAGPTSYLSIGGGRLEEMYCFTPNIARVGISVTCVTYADQVLLSVVAENDLGQAAQLLLTHVQHQIEILWKLLLHRRVPGENIISDIPYTPEMIDSPIQQIENRILEIQKQVAQVNGKNQDGEFQVLKMEYTQLVGELKRRLSDGAGRAYSPRSRCSLTSRLSVFSLKNVLSPRCSVHSLQIDADIECRGEKNRTPASINIENETSDSKVGQKGSSNSSSLINSTHRKNSFEFMRFYNKQKEYLNCQKGSVINNSVKICNEGTDSDSEDFDTDYSDEALKISDDESMNSVAGPINPTLRDLYCSNYLEHKLKRLKQQQHILAQKFTEASTNDVELDHSKCSVGLLI